MKLALALAVCAVLREATGATQPTLVTVTFPERALGVSIEADEDGRVDPYGLSKLCFADIQPRWFSCGFPATSVVYGMLTVLQCAQRCVRTT